MGRLMFYWNTAAEVTRLGRRAWPWVCDPNTTLARRDPRARMRQLLPLIPDADIDVSYSPAGLHRRDLPARQP